MTVEYPVSIQLSKDTERADVSALVRTHPDLFSSKDFFSNRSLPQRYYMLSKLKYYSASTYPLLFTSFVNFVCVRMLHAEQYSPFFFELLVKLFLIAC